jgi:endonuclease III related protein
LDHPQDSAVLLQYIYERLDGHFGDLSWWPADSPFEVIVGAILTQNTAWKNVTYAIENLKAADILNPRRLLHTPLDTIEALIRPSGYYRVKAKRLLAFVTFLHEEYKNQLDRLFAENTWLLRRKLLGIYGIGEETADSILLYAGGKPIFVVDNYTRRIFSRHSLIKEKTTYGNIQKLCMDSLPADAPLFNQYHALLVQAGKLFCRKVQRCEACPLNDLILPAECS